MNFTWPRETHDITEYPPWSLGYASVKDTKNPKRANHVRLKSAMIYCCLLNLKEEDVSDTQWSQRPLWRFQSINFQGWVIEASCILSLPATNLLGRGSLILSILWRVLCASLTSNLFLHPRTGLTWNPLPEMILELDLHLDEWKEFNLEFGCLPAFPFAFPMRVRGRGR